MTGPSLRWLERPGRFQPYFRAVSHSWDRCAAIRVRRSDGNQSFTARGGRVPTVSAIPPVGIAHRSIGRLVEGQLCDPQLEPTMPERLTALAGGCVKTLSHLCDPAGRVCGHIEQRGQYVQIHRRSGQAASHIAAGVPG